MLRQLTGVGLFKAEMAAARKARSGSEVGVSLSFRDAGGRVIHTSGFKGKVVFINFRAAWCPPCRAEMPSINALYSKLRNDDRFVFLIVDVDAVFEKSETYTGCY